MNYIFCVENMMCESERNSIWKLQYYREAYVGIIFLNFTGPILKDYLLFTLFLLVGIAIP